MLVTSPATSSPRLHAPLTTGTLLRAARLALLAVLACACFGLSVSIPVLVNTVVAQVPPAEHDGIVEPAPPGGGAGGAPAAPENEDAPTKIVKKAADEYGNIVGDILTDEEKAQAGGDRLGLYLLAWAKQHATGVKKQDLGFGLVLDRMFTPRYTYETPRAVRRPFQEKRTPLVHCDPNTAPSLGYHNCDVPNIAAEIVQDMYTTLATVGIKNGESRRVQLDVPSFGLPYYIPGERANEQAGDRGLIPTDPAQRKDKYTALELYGYYPTYTTYEGEFDRIKVITAARLLSNFGFVDSAKLSSVALMNAIGGGVSQSASNVWTDIKRGEFASVLSSGFLGWGTGFNEKLLETVLDTSDYNVIDTGAWYRPDFGETLYGARELTEQETALFIRASLLERLSDTEPDIIENTRPSDEVERLRNVPPAPKPAVATCKYRNRNTGAIREPEGPAPASGWSETACKATAKGNEDAIFDPEGGGKAQTPQSWVDEHRGWLELAERYNLIGSGGSCDLDANASNNNPAAFFADYTRWAGCWKNHYADFAARQQQNQLDEQIQQAQEQWKQQAFNLSEFFSWFQGEDIDGSRARNFNIAHNRYICEERYGTARRHSSVLIAPFVLNDDGTPNTHCPQMRPPVQDGLLGSGYPNGKHPGRDTRHVRSVKAFNLLAVLSPTALLADNTNQWLASIIGTTTRVATTIINLAYAPLLSELGLDVLFGNLMAGVRDAVYFPLAALILSLTMVVSIARQVFMIRSAKYAFLHAMSALFATIIVAGLVWDPVATIRKSEAAVGQAEAMVFGTIYSMSAGTGSSRHLCTTDGAPRAGSGRQVNPKNTPADQNLAFELNPDNLVRQMMCEYAWTFTYMPWLAAQFGTTTIDDLDHAQLKLDLPVRRLVQSPKVNMGGGIEVENWAIYQLQETSNGNTMVPDLSRPAGMTSPNMYRLVDWQAGPKNGYGRDDRFFGAWAGQTPGVRTGILTSGMLASLSGMGATAVYGLVRIQLRIALLLKIVIGMVVLLRASWSGLGAVKQYGLDLLGVAMQALVHGGLLAFVLASARMYGSFKVYYGAVALLLAAMCVLLVTKRKMLVNKLLPHTPGTTTGAIAVAGSSAWWADPMANTMNTTTPLYNGQAAVQPRESGHVATGTYQGPNPAKQAGSIAQRKANQKVKAFLNDRAERRRTPAPPPSTSPTPPTPPTSS